MARHLTQSTIQMSFANYPNDDGICTKQCYVTYTATVEKND